MQPERVCLTFADYLAREEQSPHRHEYVDGEMFAMSGASRAHNKIASKSRV